MKEDKKNRRSIRAQAFEESNYPEVSGTRCVEVHIPDSVEFMAQLAGMIALATKQFNYQNKDVARAAAIAQQWRDAYLQTDWEGCMTCDDVADCIENNENVQNAINNLINNSPDAPGRPMSSSGANDNRAEGTNPTCNLDILWSQSLAVVQVINRAIEDLLQGIESLSNSVEVANVLANLPVIDELGADAVTEFIDLMIEGISESYLAQYTIALEEELACLIFCACRDDCEITVQRIYNVYLDRLRDQFDDPGAAFVNITEIITYLFDAEIDSDVVVTALHFLFAGGMRLFSGLFGSGAVDRVLQVALHVAANDPSDAWTLICDCPGTWSYEWDFTASSSTDWTLPVGAYVAATGYQSTGTGMFPYTVEIRLSPTWGDAELVSIGIDANSTSASSGAFRGVYYPTTSFAAQTSPATQTGDYTLSFAANNPTPPIIAVQISNQPADAGTNTIRKIRLTGTGTNPFI